MPSLRAFVGHSFTEDDEELIRKFEKHFDDLELAQPEFTWDHALRAEPVSVSEKVLKLAADKNVFVAICTRKEQVLLRPYPRSWFERLTLKETDFEWKTSDWIIQETGLAKGKGLPRVLHQAVKCAFQLPVTATMATPDVSVVLKHLFVDVGNEVPPTGECDGADPMFDRALFPSRCIGHFPPDVGYLRSLKAIVSLPGLSFNIVVLDVP